MNIEDFDKEFDNIDDVFDERLINIRTAVKLRQENPVWHNNNKARYENPEYIKKVGASISAYYQSDEGKAKQAAKSHPCSDETKEKLRKYFTGKKRPPSVVEKLSDRAKGNQRRAKTIVTKLGIFPSKTIAANAHTEAGIINALNKIDHWLKTDPDNYYFIDKDGNRLPLEKRNKKSK